MVLAVAVLAECLTPRALKVQAGRVEERDLQAAEQVAAASEQQFLNAVLATAWPQPLIGRLLVRRQRFAEPAHRAVEVLQLDLCDAVERIAAAPAFGGPIAAGDHQPMQHGEEHGPLDGELELATTQQRLEHLRDAQFLPQPAEDQRRSESHGVPGLDVVLSDGV